jgi:hypothetical protein
MKPTTAVRYTPSMTFAFPDLARASSRHGRVAYLLSLAVAGATFGGSVFYKEISQTFGGDVLGVRALTLWEGAFALAALAWLVAMGLGLLCVAQKGRPRTFGLSSIAMNLAAALLVVCTMR